MASRAHAQGAQGNKDGDVRARAEKESGGAALALQATALSYRAAKRTREGGAGAPDRRRERGCAPGRARRKGRGRRAARRCTAPGTGGARRSVALAVPVAAAVAGRRRSGRRVMAAAAVGAVNEFSGWTREEETRRPPAARCLPSLRPCLARSRPAPKPGPSRPNRRISGTCTTSLPAVRRLRAAAPGRLPPGAPLRVALPALLPRPHGRQEELRGRAGLGVAPGTGAGGEAERVGSVPQTGLRVHLRRPAHR